MPGVCMCGGVGGVNAPECLYSCKTMWISGVSTRVVCVRVRGVVWCGNTAREQDQGDY